MTPRQRFMQKTRELLTTLRTLRKTSDAHVQEAADTNYRRYRIMVALAVPLIAATALWVLSTNDGSATAALWRHAIVVIDAVLAGALLLFLGLISWFRRKGWRKTAVVAQYVAVAVLIAVNATNTVAGQYISPNISVFIYACVLAGFAFYFRPTVSGTIFAINLIYLYFALGLTQHDPLLLASNRMNALATIMLGFFVSFVGWINFIARSRRIALVESQSRELAELAKRDRLSGLLNRGAMEDALRTAYLAQTEGAKPIPIFILDLDEFKQVNDGYGHPAGDRLIREVADLLTANVPAPALISRWGGDEFLVACPGRDFDAVNALAETIRDVLAATVFTIDEHAVRTSVSIGVSRIDATFDRGYRDADKALYLAKRSGKNRVKTVEDLK